MGKNKIRIHRDTGFTKWQKGFYLEVYLTLAIAGAMPGPFWVNKLQLGSPGSVSPLQKNL